MISKDDSHFESARAEYNAICTVLKEYINKQYRWVAPLKGVDTKEMQKKLEQPLMKRVIHFPTAVICGAA